MVLVSSILVGSDIAVLYDGSMSMEGFACSGGLQAIDQKVFSAIKGVGIKPDRFIFRSSTKDDIKIDALASQSDLVPEIFTGNYTLLDKAVSSTKGEYQSILLITDNVQTDGTASTEQFYKEIQNTKEISQLDIVPLSVLFDGDPFVPGAPRDYKGNRGLQIYILRYDKEGIEDQGYKTHTKIVTSLSKTAFPNTVMHFYPIDARHLKIQGSKQDSSSSAFTIESKNSFYHIIPRNPKTASSALKSNKENQLKFSFSMKSHYARFVISKGTQISISDLSLSSNKESIKCIFAPPEITPDRLSEDMHQQSQAESFTGLLRLVPQSTFWQDVKTLLFRPRLDMKFNIVLNTKENGIQLDQAIGEKYYSKDIRQLDKIYSPQDLLQILNPNSNGIVLRVKTSPKYPFKIVSGRETLIIVIIVLLLIGILTFLSILQSQLRIKNLSIQYAGTNTSIPKHGSFSCSDFIIHNGVKLILHLNNPELVLSNMVTDRNGNYNLYVGSTYTLINRNNPTQFKTLIIKVI